MEPKAQFIVGVRGGGWVKAAPINGKEPPTTDKKPQAHKFFYVADWMEDERYTLIVLSEVR